MTESLDSEMAHFTSLVEASGPSPSSVVAELRAREAGLERERCGPSQDLERRNQAMIALERRDVFDNGTGGSATPTPTPTTPTSTTTDGKTNANANTDKNNAGTKTSTGPSTNGQSATATARSSPSVFGLRKEKRYLHKRVKMYDELTRQRLRFIDGRQTEADEGVCRLEQALVVCNVSRSDALIPLDVFNLQNCRPLFCFRRPPWSYCSMEVVLQQYKGYLWRQNIQSFFVSYVFAQSD